MARFVRGIVRKKKVWRNNRYIATGAFGSLTCPDRAKLSQKQVTAERKKSTSLTYVSIEHRIIRTLRPWHCPAETSLAEQLMSFSKDWAPDWRLSEQAPPSDHCWHGRRLRMPCVQCPERAYSLHLRCAVDFPPYCPLSKEFWPSRVALS